MLECILQIWKQSGEKDELIPPYFANVWSDYLERVKNFSLPENVRHRQIHDGHLVYVQPEERRFVTPDAVRASSIVGTSDEIVAQLRTIAEAGMHEITLCPPMDHERKVFRDFAKFVMPALR